MSFTKVFAQDAVRLTITPNSLENYVLLNWENTNKSQPYRYQIFQKREGEENGQSISAKENVKVLNIYPDYNRTNQLIPNRGLSGGQIDLDGKSVPDSGILKTWLLKENIQDVDIETVSLSSFNTSPSNYLTKTNGLWNYDAVFYGMWNLWSADVYPNDQAIEHLRSFIKDGGGFMTSHHTMGYVGLDRGMNKLAKEMGVEIFSNQPYSKCPAYAGTDKDGNRFPTVSFELFDNSRCDHSIYWPSGTEVKISKKGLLTDYPFKVGDMNQLYKIPSQHGLNIFGKGDVWMQTENPSGFYGIPFKEINISPATGEKGTNNFYLHTYNNTAIINSGHSFPQITEAEVKIIANTLYYLAQITTVTNAKVHGGIDVTPPPTPSIEEFVYDKEKNRYTTQLKPTQDIGTKYTYQVVGVNRNTENKVYSNEENVVVTSGIEGYRFVFDRQPTTIPNGPIQPINSEIVIPPTIGEDAYLHIQTVDKNGNKSEVTHASLDNRINQIMDIYIPTIAPFEDITLTDQPKTYETSFTSSLIIKNYYQKETDFFRLSVQATPFKLIDGTHELPKGSLSIKPLSIIKEIDGNSRVPDITIKDKKTIDGDSVLLIEGRKSIGAYEVVFPTNALELTVDPTTAKKGTYTSTLTWQLTSAP